MAKEIVATIKLQIPAGSANPAPPIGPALGHRSWFEGAKQDQGRKAFQKADLRNCSAQDEGSERAH